MGTIDIGIGHDDDLVVTQFVGICLEVAFIFDTETDTDRLDDVHDGLCFEYTVTLYFLHVQNLAAERKNGLCVTVASLLG